VVVLKVDRYVSRRSLIQIGEYGPEPDDSDVGSVVRLSELRARTATLILGEPGAGKTTSLKQLELEVASEGGVVKLLDLRDCHSDVSLESAIESVSIVDAKAALAPLLLLDSLDETPGLVRNYVRFLQQHLTRLVNEGWHVIATCRTAESVRAIDELFDSLQSDAVHVLLPLRRTDVVAIAESYSIDVDRFVDQVGRRRLDSLASVPFTLNLLCRIYVSDAQFPESRYDLFDRAIALILAEDAIDGYAPVLPAKTHPVRQILAAERLAAFAVFAGASEFSLFAVGQPVSGVSTEYLAGSEMVDGVSIEVTNEDFQLLLRTPLFADSGSNRRQFAHRRLRDYLASRFLVRRGLEQSQLESVLLVADGNAIPPQMVDVATWLVALRPRDYEWLIVADPISLVRNRIAEDLPRLAERLVDELILRSEEAERTLSWRDELTGLANSALSRQVHEALSSKESSQWVALVILRDSFVPAARTDVANVLLDTTRSVRIRSLAADVILRQRATYPLSDFDPTDPRLYMGDVDAEIRGKILSAMWPEHLTTEVLLSLLIEPPDHFIGSYSLFVARLERGISPELAAAIVFHLSRSGDDEEDSVSDVLASRKLQSLADAALRLQLANGMTDGQIRREVAAVLGRRLHRGRQRLPVSRSRLENENLRDVLAEVVESSTEERGWFGLLSAMDEEGNQLLSGADREWMGSYAIHAPDDALGNWIQLIDRFIDSSDPGDLEWAWNQRDTRLWQGLRYRFDAIELGSELAIESKRTWELYHAIEVDVDEGAMTSEEYSSTVERLIFETRSEPARFWHLVRWLSVDLSTSTYRNDFAPDLLELANVQLLKASVREDLLELAARYLETHPTWPHRFRRDTLYRQHVAAYQALHTLEVHEPSFLDSIQNADWRLLGSVILEYRLDFSEPEHQPVRQSLLKRIHAASMVDLEAAIRRFFDRIARGGSGGTVIADLAPYICASLVPALQGAIRAGTVDCDSLIDLYLAVDAVGALSWARGRILRSTNITEIALLVGAAFRTEPEQGVLFCVEIARVRDGEAADVLLAVAHHERYGSSRMNELTPDQRMQIVVLLYDLFPGDHARPKTGLHAVTPLEDLLEWRQSLLSSVTRAGTRDGLRLMTAFASQRPDLDLRSELATAREAYRLNGWTALSIKELQAVLSQTGLRLVRSNDDLLGVVVQALQDIQGWLSGETPQAFCLWDHFGANANPKDENRVSDWYCHALRIKLERGGLIINREVEVRNETGHGVGMRQDIRVEARVPGVSDHFVTVIEVKGMWNSQLRTNLITQLAGDYLSNGGLSHGIYLVVGFDPDQITSKTKARMIRRNARGLSSHLLKQADSLAPALRIVPIVQDASMSVSP
jgi:hypothetical protein